LAVVAASVVTAAILIPEATIHWIARSRLDSDDLNLVQRGVALTPGDGDAWDRIGRLHEFDFDHPDLQAAIADFQRAVQDDPRSAHDWMDLAGAYEAAGDAGRAGDAFAHAKATYPDSAEVAFEYGNFLLGQQQNARAFEELRHAVNADPTLLQLAISRVWRSTEDIHVVDQVLPPNANAYLQAIDFFAASWRGDPAMALWEKLIALRQPFALSGAFPLIDELIREGRGDDSRRVWHDAVVACGMAQNDDKDSLIWNGDFSRDFANGGLGWRWTDIRGADISFDSGPNGGRSRSVRLDFTGGTNVALGEPAQVVPVEPLRKYHFRAMMRTEGITTESGMRFSILDLNHPDALSVSTENLTGSHPWQPVELDVTTGPQTQFLVVHLARPPSRLFENKLGGTVWIAEVSLRLADQQSGQTHQ